MPKKRTPAEGKIHPSLRTPIQIKEVRAPTVLESAAPGFVSPDLRAQVLKENVHIPGEWLEKMTLLLDQYSIAQDDPERWFKLAFSLALDHVEGMKVAPKRKPAGAPEEWGWQTLLRLRMEVDELRQQNGMSIADACRAILADHDRWKHYPPGCKHSTLVRRYHAAGENDAVVFFERVAQSKGENGRQFILSMMNEIVLTESR